MSNQALKTLIDSEPANADRTDEERLDWLNSPSDEYHPFIVTLPLLVNRFGQANTVNFFSKIEANLNNSTVKLFHTMLVNQGIDAGDPEIRQMLDAGTAAGIISAAERDAIKGLATLKTIAEKAGLSDVKLGHIEEIRRNAE